MAAVTCVFVRLSLQTAHSPFNASELLLGKVAQIFAQINYCTLMSSAGNFCKLIRYRAARFSCSDDRTELLAGKMA